ncbi:MAG: phosphatidate cytidylyltransferase [Spirochaetales bacterium]|nr:phosphatidate cytidylyltransferase [Spirochaetales bacterium]MBQ7508719.1 phosphatidate cytidylyltransferase [Spirochaetales bacterium]
MEKNLRDRIFTVVIGIPAVLALIFFIPQLNYIGFSLLVIAVGAIGSIEMSRLLFGRTVALAYIAPVITVVQYLQGVLGFNQQIPDLVFILLILFAFTIEIKAGEADDFKQSLDRSARNALLVLYPGYFLSFIMRLLALEGINNYAIMMYLILAFGNDVFAYIWGRLFGKNNKGVLKVSPKKSVAGYVGSFITTIALAFGSYALFKEHLPHISVAFRILLGAGISITANVGDLIESVFKRSAGVKDSGNIFPGRGGALDSLDSEIASAPVFFIIFSMIMEAV